MPQATSISTKEWLAAFDEVAAERFAAIEIERVMPLLVDITPAQALIWLARQFNVMGVKGWKFVDTDDERRELIKAAIELQRFKGTPWSIKEALRRVGYPNVVIIEDLTDLVQVYNGTILYDGTFTYGGDYHWAIFAVNLEAEGALTPEQIADIIAVINEYKPVRCKLLSVNIQVSFTDTVDLSEDLEIGIGDGGFDYELDFELS